MNNNVQNQLNLRFSQEELATLVQNLGSETLLGMGSHPFGSLSNEEVTLLKSTAQRSLLARGYLIMTPDNTLTIEATVRKVISFCLKYQHLVALISRTSEDDKPRMEFYYVLPGLTVQHFTPYPGIHDLTTIISRPSFEQLITEKVSKFMSDGQNLDLSFTVPQTLIAEAREEIDQVERKKVIKNLLKAGVEQHQVEAFITALNKPDLRLLIHLAATVQTKEGKSETQNKTLTLLCGQQRCWLLDDLDSKDDDSLVAIELVSPSIIEQKLSALFATLDIKEIANTTN